MKAVTRYRTLTEARKYSEIMARVSTRWVVIFPSKIHNDFALMPIKSEADRNQAFSLGLEIALP